MYTELHFLIYYLVGTQDQRYSLERGGCAPGTRGLALLIYCLFDYFPRFQVCAPDNLRIALGCSGGTGTLWLA